MSFGEELVLFLGKPGAALDEKFLLGQAFLGSFPTATMVFFQGVFAGITLILIAGALLGRMNFRAWMLFVPLWVTSSYTVGAFSIWCPDGWLAELGIIDFSGGYVSSLCWCCWIHCSLLGKHMYEKPANTDTDHQKWLQYVTGSK